jgi:hypothetical protein
VDVEVCDELRDLSLSRPVSAGKELRATEDLQRLTGICDQKLEDPGLEFARVETEIRETTPFVGLVQLLPRTEPSSLPTSGCGS